MISSTVVTILFDEYLRLTNQEEIFEAKEMFYKTSDKSKSYVQMMEEIEKKEKKTSKENDKYQKPNVTIESVYVDPTAKVNDKKVLLDLMNMIIVTHQEQGKLKKNIMKTIYFLLKKIFSLIQKCFYHLKN